MSHDYNQKRLEARIKFQEELVEYQHWMTCINCEHFQSKSEECGLYKQRPPAYIIVNGCKDYIGDVPF